MSDVRICVEIDRQEVELLPARVVLSCFGGGYGYGDSSGYGDQATDGSSGDSEANAAAVNYNDIDIHNESQAGAAGIVVGLLSDTVGGL